MTTSTSTTAAPAKKVAAPAKKAPSKAPAKKAAAAKAPAKKAAPTAEKKTYTAVGRSGQAVFRQFTTEMTHAVDVADKDGKTPRAVAGQIWKLFSTKEAAEKWAAARTVEGYDCVVVPAKVAK